MTATERWLLAVGLVVADALAIFIPLVALLGAYVVIARPPWFRVWVDELYGDVAESNGNTRSSP